MKSHDLAFNKVNFMNLKKERDMLKITLKYVSEENENLKNELEDMKITAKKNKDMLKEYINQITNKDKLFEKMVSTIEQLKSRLKAMEQFKKEKEKIELNSNMNTNYHLTNDYLNFNNNTNNHTTTTTSNNFTANNIIMTNSGENTSFGFNILNSSNNINKIKNNNTNTSNSKANKSMININTGNKGFNILKNNQNYNNIINKAKNIKYNNNQQIPDDSKDKNKKFDNIPIDFNNTNSIKYLYEKQKNILEEILGIKDDIQFLMENKNKSKMRDKLNQSLAYCNSLNSSICSENKNNDDNNKDNFNNSFTSENNGQHSIDNSYISQNISNLSVSYYGADRNILRHLNYTLNTSVANNPEYNSGSDNNKRRKRRNYNLKERYAIDENFSTFISKTNVKKDILFLIDGKENVWEIIRRGDLTADQIKKYDKERDKEYYNKIKSVVNMAEDDEQNLVNLISGSNKNNYVSERNNMEKGTNILDNNLIDIEIKEPTDIIFK